MNECIVSDTVGRTVPSGAYNAADDLLFGNLRAGRAGKTAVRDAQGSYTYGELAARVGRCAAGLQQLGVRREQRVLMCMTDTIDFPTVFLGAIYAGIVPVPVNTLLTSRDYEFMLADSRAALLIVSDVLLPAFLAILDRFPELGVLVSGAAQTNYAGVSSLLDATALTHPVDTHADEPCFWLYSSGSTGAPKGTVHPHRNLVATAHLYGQPVLGVREDDVVFSAAKLFFAYGLGNGLTFPFAVGATAVLLAERPTPASVARVLSVEKPTIFCGVPTLFNALLASAELPARSAVSLRLSASAGEALPPDTGRRWLEHFGSDILDGLGSTEMLHIFLSNVPGEVRYGTTGRAVPGYRIRLVDESGAAVTPGEVGELQVEGPTSAMHYWNNRERSRDTFLGGWTRSGDKYYQDQEGLYVYCGRTDDMLKVGGIYVAPFEVEAVLNAHPMVLEAAVVGHADADGLIKPKAYVVLRPGLEAHPGLVGELQTFVKERLAPYKYPRWIEFLAELPKTATGKIQRFKLRLPA
jgi:benzoate-CoA ligase